ncbi:MAG: hypothetical protein IJA10_10905 [Lachnospiraceae bacterium]|nr:hypothetical protein [Lachnospiraceae bacterium]
MSIKFADEIVKEIKDRGEIQVQEGYVTGEEFEKWLIDKNINILTLEEITNNLNMLNSEE